MWQDLYIHSIGAGNPFYQAWKLFSAEIWKMLECHFWANVMLRQSRLQASRASPAQKSQGLKVVCSKNFSRATFFVFLSTLMVDIYLSYLPVKQIWWKSAVWESANDWRANSQWKFYWKPTGSPYFYRKPPMFNYKYLINNPRMSWHTDNEIHGPQNHTSYGKVYFIEFVQNSIRLNMGMIFFDLWPHEGW